MTRHLNDAYARSCRHRALRAPNARVAAEYLKEAAEVEAILNKPAQPDLFGGAA